MLQVNLLPDVKKEFIKARRQRNTVMAVCVIASIIAGIVVVVLGLVMGGQQLQKNILMGNIESDKEAIVEAQDSKQLNEYLTVQNQLGQIDSLKESQPALSRLFYYLARLNPAEPNNVELSSVRLVAGGSTAATATTTTATTGTGGGVIELSGMTANFASLNVYKTTLERTKVSYSEGEEGDSLTELLFTSVVVTQAGLSQGNEGSEQVSFSITVEYNTVAFAQNSLDVKLVVPEEVTSDAIQNAPRNVFSDQPIEGSGTTTGGGNGNGN